MATPRPSPVFRAPSKPAAGIVPRAPPLTAVMLLSAAAMGYEVLLTRLFSIIQWHHFAYMMISVALLGYGAAGTFVALCQRSLLPRFDAAFAAAAVLFGVTAVAGYALAQRVAFNPLEILWDPEQTLHLVVIYGLLFLPFFLAASCICLTFTRFAGEPHRIYSFDILGAGAGSLGILLALFVLTPTDTLKLLGAIGIAAAALALMRGTRRARLLALALLGAAIAFPLVFPADWIALRPSEYKELSQTLSIDGARIVAERSSPLGLVTAVENVRVPLRHAPGMSLNATMEPPPQLAVFTDGDGLTALTRYDGRREPLAYLDQLTSALPYHLLGRPRVLVLGAGAGADVLQAIYHDARTIDAVELNPQVVDLVQRRFADFSGTLYTAPGVRMHIGEARGFVAAHHDRYDLIQVALLDAFGASSAGLYALSESYLYTIEALEDYLRHLEPGGILAITRWVNLPPRDILKLFATAVAALERSGAEPARQLALIRGWKTATLLIRNGPFTPADVAAVREFSRVRSFDVVYFPGILRAETNRYNVLEQSDFHDGALALLGGDRHAFIDRYKFDIAPATDDRPYFFHFFRWRTLPELYALKGRGGLPLLEWGYPVLIATLVQALAASVALIVLPLRFIPRQADDTARARDVHRARRHLFRGDRVRLHVRRDRIHPEISAAARTPAVCGGRRPVLVPGVRRTGEPLLGAPARERCPFAPAARDPHRRRDRHAQSDLSGRPPGIVPASAAAARRAPHRAVDRADRAARVRDGDAVPARSRPHGVRRPLARALGLGRQRLRVGRRGDPCDAAGDPFRLRRRRRPRRAALRAGRRGVPLISAAARSRRRCRT